MMFIVPMAMPALIGFGIYKAATGFAASTAPKKITRTIIEYYESCPNCGGCRDEGSEKCSYCGSNMVKSKKEVTEEEIIEKSVDGSMDLFESVNIAETVRSVLSEII